MDQGQEAKPESEDEVRATAQAGTAERILPPAYYSPDKEGLPPSSLDEALGALIADPRKYGAVALIKFAWGWAREVSARQAALERTNDELRAENRVLRERNAEYREENASLKASERERKRHRPLIIFAAGLGPVLFFMGLDALRAGDGGAGWALLVAGALSLGFGVWLGEVFSKSDK